MPSGILPRMDDQRDPGYTPFGKRQAPRALDPRESLWTLRHDNVDWSCELVFRGESNGWEVGVLNAGDLFVSRRFILRAAAERCAHEQKRQIERGWIDA
jgi:hypothetical protein